MKALIFDLDGTLIDSTYQHVIAWQRAFASAGIVLPSVEIHRRIGMNGSLMIAALSRAFDLRIDTSKASALEAAHDAQFGELKPDVKLLPRAGDVASVLESVRIPWAIVTSGKQSDAGPFLDAVHAGSAAAVITGEDEPASKPSPTPIVRALKKLRCDAHEAGMVGDSVWDMLGSREAGSFGIGVLSGGYAADELTASGAFRVYRDVAEFLTRLEEVGIETP